jgi:amino acid adenylation domain-containing protein
VPLIDLRDVPFEARESKTQQLAAEEVQRPFDLRRAPLLRVALLRLAEEEHVLLLTLHHIISDGWSVRVLVRELSELYGAFTRGESSPLAELTLQYADYGVWQREQLQGARLDQELSYWREQLAGAPQVLELPLDHARPAVQSYRGAQCSLELPAELVSELRKLSRREGVTRYMVLLAGFFALLARYTGQRDLLVGTPVANRTRVETEPLVGLFANTLVMRARLEDGPSFGELLKRVREAVLGGQQQQAVPFERVVEELQPERDLSRTPLFQVMFVAEEEAAGRGWELPGLELRAERVETGTSKFELTLFVEEQGASGGLRVTAEYNTDLFAVESMERMLRHYRRLLESAVADSGVRVAELALLEEAEREQLLVGWNQTASGYGGELIHELFERQSRRTPERVALVCGEQELSYAELERRVNRLAGWLRKQGVGVETRVGVLMQRNVELVVSLLAVLKAGGAYVPLDPEYPEERLRFMVEDAEARLLLTQRVVLERHGWLAEQQVEVVAVEERERSFSDSAGTMDDTETDDSGDTGSAVSAANLAYVIYTSGSTGRPKGVAITHHSASVLLRWSHEHFTEAELAGVLFSTSVCFDLSIFEMFVPLTSGGSVIVARDALELPELARRERVTLVNTVPSAMAELIRLGGVPETVVTVNLAGEALSRRLVEGVYDLRSVTRVWNLYGPTEDTTYTTGALVPRGVAQPPTIGRPVAETRMYVLDERLEPVAVGVRGELYVAGAGLARGYLKRAALTAERFVPDPHALEPGARMYRTGDVGRWLAEGELEYLGRVDHQVKLRGYRIELGEVEAAIVGQGGVSECVCVASEDESGQQQLVAYVVAANAVAANTDLSEIRGSELRRRLREKLPDYMVPSVFVMLDALPLTPNGKVDRKRLPAPERMRAEAEYVAPRTAIEEIISSIWSEVLRLERVGVYDNFFELGGHSLLATQVTFAIREKLGVELPLRRIFETPTVAGLAELVETSNAHTASTIKPLSRERYRVKGFTPQALSLPEVMREQ